MFLDRGLGNNNCDFLLPLQFLSLQSDGCIIIQQKVFSIFGSHTAAYHLQYCHGSLLIFQFISPNCIFSLLLIAFKHKSKTKVTDSVTFQNIIERNKRHQRHLKYVKNKDLKHLGMNQTGKKHSFRPIHLNQNWNGGRESSQGSSNCLL